MPKRAPAVGRGANTNLFTVRSRLLLIPAEPSVLSPLRWLPCWSRLVILRLWLKPLGRRPLRRRELLLMSVDLFLQGRSRGYETNVVMFRLGCLVSDCLRLESVDEFFWPEFLGLHLKRTNVEALRYRMRDLYPGRLGWWHHLL